MHIRVLAGVGAWLVGVGAATGGSLLAVSLLGQGIATSTSQQLTAAAVNRALAAEASDTPDPAGTPSPAASATRSGQARVSPTARPQTETMPSARASRSRPAASPSAQTTTAGPTSTVLISPGGTVVADCRQGGAYLVSWIPAPGYAAGTVVRGPAVTVRVRFASAANAVTMLVSCPAGVPTTSNTVTGSGTGTGGTDGGGGDE